MYDAHGTTKKAHEKKREAKRHNAALNRTEIRISTALWVLFAGVEDLDCSRSTVDRASLFPGEKLCVCLCVCVCVCVCVYARAHLSFSLCMVILRIFVCHALLLPPSFS